MSYIYQVSFDLLPDQMSQLRIGSSLERVLGYLRTLLPAGSGYITCRAMYSVEEGKINLVFQSVWDSWEDVVQHKQSSLAEDKVLSEFQPHVALEDLSARIYREVE
jgi:hypothetical protein